MSKTKKPDYGPAIDAMNKDVVASFQYPWATGAYDPSSQTYSYNMNPEQKQTYDMASGIRNDLLKSLGLASTGEDAYTKALMNESLRLSQPKLENSLIGRGLGGSSVYGTALTDLVNQAATQSVIQGRQARLNDLSTLEGILTNMYNLGGNTLNQVSNTGLAQQQIQQNKANSLINMENSQVNAANQAQQQLWSNLTGLGLLGGYAYNTLNNPSSSGTTSSNGVSNLNLNNPFTLASLASSPLLSLGGAF